MKSLRNYESFPISRKISSPIMFMGLPLLLSIAYLTGIVIPIIISMILTSMDISPFISISIAGGLITLFCGGIKTFYKKYGINGFQQQQRDKMLPSQFEADKSVNEILRSKIIKAKK